MLSRFFADQKRFLDYFFDHIDQEKSALVLDQLFACRGTVYFTGIGKSGIIAEKLVQTLASTGTRAAYLASMNALHGDIGILKKGDLVVFLTKSGDSPELIDIVLNIKNRESITTILWTCNARSRLASFVDTVMVLPLAGEICPFDLAPTTSCAIQLIFGDIIAMGLMQKREFTMEEYALNHPSGNIGDQIAITVKELMLTGDELPVCSPSDYLCDVLVILSDKKCGCLLVTDQENVLQGIFTDGDLRRAIQREKMQVFERKLEELMTAPCLFVEETVSVAQALEMMERPGRQVMMLPIVRDGILQGLVHMHDIISPLRRREKQFARLS